MCHTLSRALLSPPGSVLESDQETEAAQVLQLAILKQKKKILLQNISKVACKIFLDFMCINFLSVLSACTFVRQMHGWCPRRPAEGVDALELELRMVVRHHVGAGNQN